MSLWSLCLLTCKSRANIEVGIVSILMDDALSWGMMLCPRNDTKLIRCVLSMTLNSPVVVQGMTVKLRPCLRFRACGWGCVRWKAPAGKGVVGLLSWHGSHFWVYILHFVRCVTVTVLPNQIIIIIKTTVVTLTILSCLVEWHSQLGI